MERIYLGDWFFNAGILGFLRINKDLVENGNITIAENYIEFQRTIFKGFGDRYFQYAFNQYGRYNRVLNKFRDIITKIEELSHSKNKNSNPVEKNSIDEIYDEVKRILDNYKPLGSKIGKPPSKKDVNKDISILKRYTEKAISVLVSDKQDLLEKDARIYVRKFTGQKSFLNNNIDKDILKKFKEEFEIPLLHNRNPADKKTLCFNCNRTAKKGTYFDTGLSLFYGMNNDASNFVYKFHKIPLCELCEIIYFCAWAGISEFNGKYYFANQDDNINALIKSNDLMKYTLSKDEDLLSSKLLRFFSEYILRIEAEKATHTLQNTTILEIDLSNSAMPKAYSFNLSKEKAEYIKSNSKSMKNLSTFYYKGKKDGKKIYVLPQLINKILNDSLNYQYLSMLTRRYIKEETNFKASKLQTLNLLIKNYLKIVGGKHIMAQENELWALFREGERLANKMRNNDAENKIGSIAYRLLNALRIEDMNKFMDILIRTCMSYDVEVPSKFAYYLNNKESFLPIGYSFLNGFLSGKSHQIEEENKDE